MCTRQSYTYTVGLVGCCGMWMRFVVVLVAPAVVLVVAVLVAADAPALEGVVLVQWLPMHCPPTQVRVY